MRIQKHQLITLAVTLNIILINMFTLTGSRNPNRAPLSVPLTREMIYESTHYQPKSIKPMPTRPSFFAKKEEARRGVIIGKTDNDNNDPFIVIDDEGFNVIKDNKRYEVDKAFVDPLIRDLSKEDILKLAQNRAVRFDIKELTGGESEEFAINASGNVRGAGPVAAAVFYGTVRAGAYCILWGAAKFATKAAVTAITGAPSIVPGRNGLPDIPVTFNPTDAAIDAAFDRMPWAPTGDVGNSIASTSEFMLGNMDANSVYVGIGSLGAAATSTPALSIGGGIAAAVEALAVKAGAIGMSLTFLP
jgi:hypothetical protein